MTSQTRTMGSLPLLSMVAAMFRARWPWETHSNLRIPIGDVLSSPTYRALETVRLGQFTTPQISAELGDNGQSMQGGTPAPKPPGCRSKEHTFQAPRTQLL